MGDIDSASLRRRAVMLYYQEHRKKSAICRELQVSRPWLDRWLARYAPDHVDESLQDRSHVPHKAATLWPEATKHLVLEMRRTRSQQPYALRGAQAIHYELQRLGYTPLPPTRTIHQWLDAAGVVRKRPPPVSPSTPVETPLPTATSVNAVQQLDLKGPIYLQGDSHKYYIAVLRDVHSKRISLRALRSRQAHGIVSFVLESWRWMGTPQALQMDNALEFRGSNRYPRSLSQVARVALGLGVTVYYIPARQPCFNGCIERFNGFLEEHLLSVRFADYASLCQQTLDCQAVCNATHRLRGLAGQTPDEACAQVSVQLLTDAAALHARTSVPQTGTVIFVRRVRQSGRITLAATDRFMVDPQLQGCYVAAQVDIAQQTVTILHQGQPLVTYDYSAETLGAWADGLPTHQLQDPRPGDCNGSSSTPDH